MLHFTTKKGRYLIIYEFRKKRRFNREVCYISLRYKVMIYVISLIIIMTTIIYISKIRQINWTLFLFVDKLKLIKDKRQNYLKLLFEKVVASFVFLCNTVHHSSLRKLVFSSMIRSQSSCCNKIKRNVTTINTSNLIKCSLTVKLNNKLC